MVMSFYSTRQLAENKLILLYLIEKMQVVLSNNDTTKFLLSNSEICQFALEKNYMDYFTVQQYLEELVESGFLLKTKDNNATRYEVTEQGNQVLGFFMKQIPDSAKLEINSYVYENCKRLRAEYEVTANYFPELNNTYLVKCGVYDSDGSNLMEISVSVANKEQARQVCQNWKNNVNTLYGSIFRKLLIKKEDMEPSLEKENSKETKP